jgi:hypothetical protein
MSAVYSSEGWSADDWQSPILWPIRGRIAHTWMKIVMHG